MIGHVVSFLQKKLIGDFASSGDQSLAEPKIVFLGDQTGDSISFQGRALTMLLINLEQEQSLRKDDPFQEVKNGAAFAVFPAIRLNLYLLVVANWDDYITGLNQLSRVIRYFQANRVFVQQNEPELDPSVEKLSVELITLPFAQQNEVWNALRTTYRPSVLFKVRMVVFSQELVDPAPETKEVQTKLHPGVDPVIKMPPPPAEAKKP